MLGTVNEAEPEHCLNCGAPIADGWVIHTGGPKEGAVLTSDHVCPDCGAPFWHSDEIEDEDGDDPS